MLRIKNVTAKCKHGSGVSYVATAWQYYFTCFHCGRIFKENKKRKGNKIIIGQ